MIQVTRSLAEINADIKEYEVALIGLRDEVKLFQSMCPHPTDFLRETWSQSRDEYGMADGGTRIYECLMCGHRRYEEVG